MQRKEPLKEILAANRALWDHDGMRPSVRVNFTKVLMCRTEALGAEVYASSTVQKIAPLLQIPRVSELSHRATRLW